MADSQISRVVIPCLAIRLKNQVFINGDTGQIGRIVNVPCKDSFIDEVLWWATPVKDESIFSTIQFTLSVDTNGKPLDPPSFDSFYVQSIRDKLSNSAWMIYCLTNNDFKNSCNTCCDDAAVPMPGVNGSFNPIIAPCQELCAIDAAGDIGGIFGLPGLQNGATYHPVGSYNNNSLATANPAGYSTVAALLVFLNSQWTNVGSPNVTFVWTATPDNLTLTATGGNEGDNLCVEVIAA